MKEREEIGIKGLKKLLGELKEVSLVESIAKYDNVIGKDLTFIQALTLLQENRKRRLMLNITYTHAYGLTLYNYQAERKAIELFGEELARDCIELYTYDRTSDNQWDIFKNEEGEYDYSVCIFIDEYFLPNWIVIELKEDLGEGL
jgi:hypothetical protein